MSKASSLLRIAQDPTKDLITDNDLTRFKLICAKCGKVANLYCLVVRETKSGRYRYHEWRHRDNRKKGGYVHHYKRAE